MYIPTDGVSAKSMELLHKERASAMQHPPFPLPPPKPCPPKPFPPCSPPPRPCPPEPCPPRPCPPEPKPCPPPCPPCPPCSGKRGNAHPLFPMLPHLGIEELLLIGLIAWVLLSDGETDFFLLGALLFLLFCD